MLQKTNNIRRILQSLVKTRDEELGCDDIYKVLDQYAEAVARGDNTVELMPLVKEHLELCPDCFEECEALINVIEESFS